MHSINENEIRRLSLWAAEGNRSEYFDDLSSYKKASFWADRKEDATYMQEYDFKNVFEFETLCSNALGHELDEKIKKVVSVATMKNSPREDDEKEETRNNAVLPEYIYVF